jgi:transposase
MSQHKEKPYPSEFKESAVKLAIESNNPIAQTARELGINVNTIHTWIRQYSKPKNTTSTQEREMNYHFDEVKQLKKELVKVTQERDLLKKAAAYFAKEFK